MKGLYQGKRVPQPNGSPLKQPPLPQILAQFRHKERRRSSGKRLTTKLETWPAKFWSYFFQFLMNLLMRKKEMKMAVTNLRTNLFPSLILMVNNNSQMRAQVGNVSVWLSISGTKNKNLGNSFQQAIKFMFSRSSQTFICQVTNFGHYEILFYFATCLFLKLWNTDWFWLTLQSFQKQKIFHLILLFQMIVS